MQNLRIPRPLGMTQALQDYHNTGDISLLENIQALFIQNWIMNSQTICGKFFNIFELSHFLKCEPDKIRIHMRDQLLSTKLWDKDKQEDLINSLIGQQVAWVLEDRMEIEGQVNMLKRSQKGQYTPFVTAEVNKAIGLKMQATNNLGSILKSLQGGGSINIFNQQNNTEISASLTIEQAVQIVGEENSKLINTDKQMQYIEAHYDAEEFPEVVATKQIGVDTTKEGLNINSAELAMASDSYKEIMAASDEDHHEMRREIEMQIDPDEDDPEMQIYPM